jgi:Fe-S cluster biogenesis protein NfuA
MFISYQETPNPSTLKFMVEDQIILTTGAIEFKNQKQASKQSPLALQLFEINGVKSIMFGYDFIAITKNDEINWNEIKTEIQATIMDFFVNKNPILYSSKDQETDQKKHDKNNTSQTHQDEESEVVKQIKELIEIKVRPSVAMDGGDIVFHSFENGIVYLVLKGSCSGCPSSTITLKNGIENMLKHYIPEVEAVEQIDGE